MIKTPYKPKLYQERDKEQKVLQAQIALKRDHAFINIVGLGCQETHAKVLQRCLVTSHENHFHVLYGVLKEHILEKFDYKVLVFCTTAAVTRIVYEMLSGLNMNVREMHSQKLRFTVLTRMMNFRTQNS